MSELTRQSSLKTFRRRFVVDVTWSQPPEQSYADDWGSVLGEALAQQGPCLYDIDEGPLVILVAEEVTDGAG
jgi:hypothetical protein